MGSTMINGYSLLGPFTTANAGMCQWTFAQKDGHEYFIKEFLSPKYPTDDSILGPVLTAKMRASADHFFATKKQFYDLLMQKCRTGNNMVVLDFFRYESKYYVVTDKVTGRLLTVKEVSELPDAQKYVFLKSLLYTISKLHQYGIVHSDLRPENILVKETTDGYCTAKTIDFDSGFFESDIPEAIEGSQNYFSPEAVLRTGGEKVPVTTKSDIWALGLLIHQYWSGKLPRFSNQYHYASEAVLNGDTLSLDPSLPERLRILIGRMLNRFAADRPGADEALLYLSGSHRSEGEAKNKPVKKYLTSPDDSLL